VVLKINKNTIVFYIEYQSVTF